MTALRSFVNELGIFFEGRRVSCIVECGFRLVNRGIDWMKSGGANSSAQLQIRLRLWQSQSERSMKG